MYVSRPTKVLGLAVLVSLLVVAASLTERAPDAQAAGVDEGIHGRLVVEQVRTDIPIVANGSVLAHAQVGNRVFVGGDFTSVQRRDGTSVAQPYLFAYDIDSGQFDDSFRPVLNNVVNALEPTANGDGLYAGGKFWKWDNSFPLRIAKLDANGVLDTNFAGSANAVVRSIAATTNRVFLAGDFTAVGGQPRSGFAALNAASGTVDPGFVMNVGDPIESLLGRRVVASNDGNTVFGLHFGNEINGQPREVLAKFDVSGPTATLANWQVQWDMCEIKARDIDISPDDSYIVVVGQGADHPPFCDSALKYPTAGTGLIPYQWSARMYSSVFAVAISDTAIYVGGHFCSAPKNGALPGGITDPDGRQANHCGVNNAPHVLLPTTAVERNQMAALDPVDGRALNWNPGSDAFVGVLDLTLTGRGLLAGQDGNVFGDQLVGRSGFFDFGSFDDVQAPTLQATATTNGQAVTITGTLSDDVRAREVAITARHSDGRWLQPDGTLSAAFFQFTLAPEANNGSFGLTTAAPIGEYSIRIEGDDFTGKDATPIVQSLQVGNPGGAATGTCAATSAGQQVTLEWGAFNNEDDTYQVRNAGGWVATIQANTTSWTGPADTYSIRSREGGQTVDIACETDPDAPVEPPAPAPVCATQVNGDSITLSWPGFNGEDDGYQVRTPTGWVATLDASARDWTFNSFRYQPPLIIRSKEAGATVELECTWTPPPPPQGDGPTSAFNLALGRSATQSSVAFDNVPAGAVDGDTTVGGGTVTSATTMAEIQPWWEVDLGSAQALGEVEFWTVPVDKPAHILISSQPMQGRTLTELLADPAVSSFDAIDVTQTTITDVAGTVGRYVRVQLAGRGALDLHEVVVVPQTRPTNLATGKVATQSSLYRAEFGPEWAIDGNLRGVHPVDRIVHTGLEAEPWWEVDLGSSQSMGTIEVWNRLGVESRLDTASVFVSNTPMTGKTFVELSADPNVATFALPDPAIRQAVLDVDGTTGRYVRIQLPNTQYLQLAEVVITAG